MESDPIDSVVLFDGVAVGYIGLYAVKDCPWPQQNLTPEIVNESAGIDVYIGDPDNIGKGLGQKIISLFLKEKVWPKFNYCLVDPMPSNEITIGCFEKVGFKKHTLAKERFDENSSLLLMILNKP